MSQSISLSFGGGVAKNAWDDRELINAYDAAMDEFHAHHPGPGSWLDKAMAAQAAGRPLAGASDHGTAWYSATSAVEVETQEEPPIDRPMKRTRRTNDVDTSQVNPYAGPLQNSKARREARRERPRSPHYVPPSPPSGTSHLDNGGSRTPESALDGAEDSTLLLDPHLTDTRPVERLPAPPAPIAVSPTTALSAEDALSYAMTSQYWAGYWMGVSQAIRDTTTQTISTGPPVAARLDDSAPKTNIIRTAHQFAARKQLKR